jgi:hypothetical protein
MAFKKKRTIKRKTSFKRKSFAKKARKSPLKLMIRKEIARNIEDKHANFVNLGHNNVPSTATTAASLVVPVSPQVTGISILQGTSQGARVGNAIKIKKATLRGTIQALAQSATTNTFPKPMYVMMFLFYDKLNRTITPDPFASNDFFQFGGTSADFRNDLVDNWADVNSDRWAVLYRKNFRVGYAYYGGTGGVATEQYYANNDFKYNQNFSIDITKHLVTHVKFNDNNADPTTRGLWCMWVPINADGTAIGSTEIPSRVQFSVDYKYEDA